MWLKSRVLLFSYVVFKRILSRASFQLEHSVDKVHRPDNIPESESRTTTEALHVSVKLPFAVQLKTNVELVRVILGPVETTLPLMSVHV